MLQNMLLSRLLGYNITRHVVLLLVLHPPLLRGALLWVGGSSVVSSWVVGGVKMTGDRSWLHCQIRLFAKSTGSLIRLS